MDTNKNEQKNSKKKQTPNLASFYCLELHYGMFVA